MTNTTCKYCDKEGTYSFGWLDSKGEWQDKHLTCDDHAPVSIGQQRLAVNLAHFEERTKLLFTRNRFVS